MRTIFRLIVILPIALIMLLFAVANRHWVTVSFDPFPGNDIAGPQIDAPLFILLLMAGALGVLVGGAVVWLRQGRYRRMARDNRAAIAEAQGQASDLRDKLAALQSASARGGLPSLPGRDAA